MNKPRYIDGTSLLIQVSNLEKQNEDLQESCELFKQLIRVSQTVPLNAMKDIKDDEVKAFCKGYVSTHYVKNDDLEEPIYKPHTYYICSNCARKTVIKENSCSSCGYKMNKK